MSSSSAYDHNKNVLDADPLFSKVLGGMFFILAVVSLVVGHFDYMRCIRALEDADKLIQPDAEEGQQASRIKWHSASSAKQAHSGRVVHIVEIVIALAVSATALIILITFSQGKINPVPPTLAQTLANLLFRLY